MTQKMFLFLALMLSVARASLVSGTAAFFLTSQTELQGGFKGAMVATLNARLAATLGSTFASSHVAINAFSPGHNLQLLVSFNVTVVSGDEAAVVASMTQELFWNTLTVIYRKFLLEATKKESKTFVYAIIAVPGCCHGLFNVGPFDKVPTFKPLDLESKALTYVAYASVTNWNKNPPTNASRIGPPVGSGPLKKTSICHGAVSVPATDEDYPPDNSAPGRRGVLTWDVISAEFNPVIDDNRDFPNYQSSIMHRNAIFGRILPHTDQVFESLIRDSEVSRLCFAGLVSHRLRPVSWRHRRKHRGERWAVKLAYLHRFGVRSGYERYGANAYFSKRGKLMRIFWAHGRKNVRPGDAEWDHAKWAFVSSVGVGVTIIDHLLEVHLTVSNHGLVALREKLSPDHPIRMWMKPFIFGAASINSAVNVALCAERQMVHRTWAFSKDGLIDLMTHSLKTMKYRPAPSKVWRLRRIPDKTCPYVRDSIGLWFVIKYHVYKIMRVYFPTEKDLLADKGMAEMYEAMRVGFKAENDVPKKFGRHGVVELLAHYIFNGVGFHEQVGTIYDYYETIRDVGLRLSPGKSGKVAIQEWSKMLALCATTGRLQPKLLQDFSHLLKTDSNYGKAKTELDRFQRHLRKLSAKIAKRNKRRPMPYHYYDPKNLETSVSK